jgi:hypothetical protein
MELKNKKHIIKNLSPLWGQVFLFTLVPFYSKIEKIMDNNILSLFGG